MPVPLTQDEPDASPLGWARRTFNVRRGEGVTIALSVLMGFLLFSGYSIVKPLRDAANNVLADRLGERAVAGTTTATLVAMAVAVLIAGACITLLSWRRFFVAAQGAWLAGTIGFAILFRAEPSLLQKDGEAAWWLPAAFVVCVNVFNLLSLSFLWSRVSDLFNSDQAKRVYPIIGLGITLGGIAGAALVTRYAKAWPLHQFVFIAAGLLTLSVAVSVLLARRPERPRGAAEAAAERARADVAPGMGAAARGAAEGVAAVVRSPYLMGLCAYLLLYSTTGTILYFEQQRIVRAAEVTAEARAAASASIDLYTNIVTIVLQGLVASRIVQAIGVARALTVTPVTTALGVIVLWHAPQLAPLIFVQVGRRGLHFAIDRPAREALYTVLGRAERHKAKGFIDTFVYRLGDQAGAWMQAALGAAGPASVYGTVAVCVVWGGLGVWMGRRMRAHEALARGASRDGLD